MVWKEKIDIKRYIDEDADECDFPKVRQQIVGELRKSKILAKNSEAIEYIDEMEHEDDIDAFDDLLNEIYEIADNERVWLGL